jgi:hypothetical protein
VRTKPLGPSVPVRLRVGRKRRQAGYSAPAATKSPAEAGLSRDVRHLSSGRLPASARIERKADGILHNEKPRRSGASRSVSTWISYQPRGRLGSPIGQNTQRVALAGPLFTRSTAEARAPLPARPTPSTCASTPQIPPSPLPVTPRDCRCAGSRADRESAAPRTSAQTRGRCGSYRCGRCTTRRRRRSNRRCLCRHRGLARSGAS